ncbi:MAG: alpha-L-rhamnosidase N-terminal domain-containing protein [Phycisphaerae bacterium]|nr:alpha-L-rhamnosidase N-terminal domain-containing protein [Phycisphaerae bacterium]
MSEDVSARYRPYVMNLTPAQWIWLPSSRTLPNTFVLFRKELMLDAAVKKATGWITADSRYRLTVNGERVQWGPAPCDPRHLDVDPFDVAKHLRPGKNVIGVEVLYYGIGEGTWPAGKPGLLLSLKIEQEGGKTEQIVSDDSWSCRVDRAHPPGRAKRWFLRALQEVFDARLHPVGWDTPAYRPDEEWVSSAVIGCPADKPAACAGHWTTDTIDSANRQRSDLRARQIPLVRESRVPVARLADSGRIVWRRDPDDWFDFRMPGAFEAKRDASAVEQGQGVWRLSASGDPRIGTVVTFELSEQVVGFPYFTIEAPGGTVVELMVQEAHEPAKVAWMDNHFYAWSRFICRDGVNAFEAFDYESLRWMQIHVRGVAGPVTIRDVGVRRRVFDWPKEPKIRCDDPRLQRLFEASVNTLRNSAIETVVDGMGRERQQYSGDCGHQLHAVRYAFGEPRISARYLRTFSEGLTTDGYFLDCWPASDRLARIAQKQVDGAYWGPLLDHGIGFNFDCWNHCMETGDQEPLREPYPRLLRFADYLLSIRDKEGLLPVEGLGIPTVWIDHDAYRQQRHKQCAFNLYAAAMFRHALAPICELFGDGDRARRFEGIGDEILQSAVRRFWSTERELFVDNLPWLEAEKQIRLSDRSLATAILFDQCPEGQTGAGLRALADCPPEMGLSYPANAGWRLWALAKLSRIDVVLDDFRQRWATMRSVKENNALQECWHANSDSTDEWSHCPVAPLYVLYQDIAGIRPVAPGFKRIQVRPQLGDLNELDVTAQAPVGAIRLTARREGDEHRVELTLPDGCEGELLVPDGSDVTLDAVLPDHSLGLKRYRLLPGSRSTFSVKR